MKNLLSTSVLPRLIPPSAAVSVVVASAFIGCSLWQTYERTQAEFALYQAASILTDSKLTPPQLPSQDAPKQKQMVISLEQTKVDDLFESARQVSRSSFNFGLGGSMGLLLYVSATFWIAQWAKKDLENRLGLNVWGVDDRFEPLDRLP